jgi:hypothetical protein
MLLASPAFARADVVLTWNEQMVKTLIGQAQSPFAQARLAAIVQLAVFEAVNAITGEYEPYLGITGPSSASAEAAAATAAHRVLKAYFPAAPDIDALLAASLAAIPDGIAKDNGILVGEAAAAAMVLDRASDGSSPLTISPIGPAEAGVYQITAPPGCAATATGGSFYNWRDVTPFGIPDVEAFRLPPPPPLHSNQYAKDHNEVQRVGRIDSTERSAEQSDKARFFQATSPTLIFNLAARQIATAKNRSLSDNARSLALINMATNDSLVASFDNKYHYNFWRPETSIRFTGDYGNRKTSPPDTAWLPFIGTPCFPSYPSNHASGSNGASEALRRLYGEAGHAIVIENPFVASVAGLRYEYTSFNQICNDVDEARINGGIHYRFDQVAGNQLGRAVATEVVKNNLRKVNGR